jgi:hypothetical protein
VVKVPQQVKAFDIDNEKTIIRMRSSIALISRINRAQKALGNYTDAI